MLRPSSSRSAGAALALTCALGSVSSTARAQTEPVDALLHEGVELRRSHRDLEAWAVFRRAYDQSHGPRALAQMALAEQALGRWVAAEGHLRTALAASDPWIVRSRATLEAALGVIEGHLGGLWIEGGVPGAEVLVDGQRVAVLPVTEPMRVVAGSLTVTLRAEGYETVTRHVVVSPGGDAREEVRLTRVAERSTQGDGTTSTPSPHASVPRSDASVPGGTQRALAWASGAGALVGVGIGVGFLVVREGDVAAFNDSSCPPRSSSTQPVNCSAMLDSVHADETIAMAGFIAGGALAVTSILLFATAPSRGRAHAHSTRFGCAGGPGTLGVICMGSF